MSNVKVGGQKELDQGGGDKVSSIEKIAREFPIILERHALTCWLKAAARHDLKHVLTPKPSSEDPVYHIMIRNAFESNRSSWPKRRLPTQSACGGTCLFSSFFRSGTESHFRTLSLTSTKNA